MKSLFVILSAGALLIAAPAIAQSQDHHNKQAEHHDKSNTQNSNQGHNRQTATPGGHMSGPSQSMTRMAPHRNTAQTNRSQPNRSQVNRAQANRAQANSAQAKSSHNGWSNHNRATNNRARGNAKNYSHLHRNYTATKRYRFGSYHRPHGYYSHRWVYGQRMPSAFFARNYWITNFSMFGLMLPPPGTVWVRYGSDAVLIDQYTGEVIRVVYNIFY